MSPELWRTPRHSGRLLPGKSHDLSTIVAPCARLSGIAAERSAFVERRIELGSDRPGAPCGQPWLQTIILGKIVLGGRRTGQVAPGKNGSHRLSSRSEYNRNEFPSTIRFCSWPTICSPNPNSRPRAQRPSSPNAAASTSASWPARRFKTDAVGMPVHEECYTSKFAADNKTSSPTLPIGN